MSVDALLQSIEYILHMYSYCQRQMIFSDALDFFKDAFRCHCIWHTP
jgi:hypothetical protein